MLHMLWNEVQWSTDLTCLYMHMVDILWNAWAEIRVQIFHMWKFFSAGHSQKEGLLPVWYTFWTPGMEYTHVRGALMFASVILQVQCKCVRKVALCIIGSHTLIVLVCECLLKKQDLMENTDFWAMLGLGLICWSVNDYAMLYCPKVCLLCSNLCLSIWHSPRLCPSKMSLMYCTVPRLKS